MGRGARWRVARGAVFHGNVPHRARRAQQRAAVRGALDGVGLRLPMAPGGPSRAAQVRETREPAQCDGTRRVAFANGPNARQPPLTLPDP